VRFHHGLIFVSKMMTDAGSKVITKAKSARIMNPQVIPKHRKSHTGLTIQMQKQKNVVTLVDVIATTIYSKTRAKS
jgi:hypothetical protein